MTEIGYRKTKITSSDWINWLEPLRYVKEKQTNYFLDKIHFKNVESCSDKKEKLKLFREALARKQSLIKKL